MPLDLQFLDPVEPPVLTKGELRDWTEVPPEGFLHFAWLLSPFFSPPEESFLPDPSAVSPF